MVQQVEFNPAAKGGGESLVPKAALCPPRVCYGDAHIHIIHSLKGPVRRLSSKGFCWQG